MTPAEIEARTENVRVSTQGIIIEKWPDDALAQLLNSIGLAGLTAGGVAYYLAGYPDLSLKLVPSLISWSVGIGFLWQGLHRLRDHQNRKMSHFLQVFHVADSAKASLTFPGVGQGVKNLFRRKKPPSVQTQLDQV